MEPGASSVEERLRMLSELSKNGIKIWVFIGPVTPFIADVEALVDVIEEVKPRYVLVDRLRLKERVWEWVREFTTGFKPELLSDYERIFLRGEDYYSEVLEGVIRRCEEKGGRYEMNRFG